MKDLKCLLIHTPQLCKDVNDKNLCSNINFCAMGLYSLASEIEKEGFNSEIIHLGVEKYINKSFLLSDYVTQNNIKFVAFSLQWHPQSYDVLETAKVLKEKCPNIFIMLGGFTASYFAEEIMNNFPYIDIIIKGEGEDPIRKICKNISENIQDFSNIPNLYWRKNEKIIINKNKFVATDKNMNTYEFFNIKKMKNYKKYAKIPFFLEYSKENQLSNQMTSQGICLGRGCTGNCTWCGGGFEAMKAVTGRDFVSYRDADNVISEIKMLKEECNIEVFRFVFDPTPSKREHLYKLLTKISQEFKGNLKTLFTLNGLPDKEFLNLYSKAFSKDSLILISPEFFSEKLRKEHKSFYYSNKELENMLELMDKMEIKSELYFSILPITTPEDNLQSENYGKLLVDKYKFVEKYYQIPIIYEPAAPWTMNPSKFGLTLKEKSFMDYYRDTKCVEYSFENTENFLSYV